jgi:hypothetical protein
MIKLSAMSIKVTAVPHVTRQIIIRHTSFCAVKCIIHTTRARRVLTAVANPSFFFKINSDGMVS